MEKRFKVIMKGEFFKEEIIRAIYSEIVQRKATHKTISEIIQQLCEKNRIGIWCCIAYPIGAQIMFTVRCCKGMDLIIQDNLLQLTLAIWNCAKDGDKIVYIAEQDSKEGENQVFCSITFNKKEEEKENKSGAVSDRNGMSSKNNVLFSIDKADLSDDSSIIASVNRINKTIANLKKKKPRRSIKNLSNREKQDNLNREEIIKESDSDEDTGDRLRKMVKKDDSYQFEIKVDSLEERRPEIDSGQESPIFIRSDHFYIEVETERRAPIVGVKQDLNIKICKTDFATICNPIRNVDVVVSCLLNIAESELAPKLPKFGGEKLLWRVVGVDKTKQCIKTRLVWP